MKYGNGKECEGKTKNITSCFEGCCNGEMQCEGIEKCVPNSFKCDYDNDCFDFSNTDGPELELCTCASQPT